MIQKINYFITRVFDIILYPFSFISEFWGILFLSILMSFVVLWIYKWVSSPRLIRATKDQIKANILAIRIYKDSGRVIAVSFLKSLLYTFKYFGLNLLPLLVIIPILFPAFVQMDVRYGLRPFKVGEEIVIKASFSENPFDLDVKLQNSENFKPKMNPVFINAYKDADRTKPIKEANWKMEAAREGNTKIKIKVKDKVFDKSLIIGASRHALSNKKMEESSFEHFLYPAEKLLDGSNELKYIYIHYPGKSISFAGISTYWWVFNLILVVIIVLALKNRFGIEF
jgi:hypothetical protein